MWRLQSIKFHADANHLALERDMDRSDTPEFGRLRAKIAPDYTSTGISIFALIVSFSMQFVHYGRALTGTSDQAISGATILSVSLVFTGLMFVASYHYIQRLREYQLALEEVDVVASLIHRGERAVTLISLRRNVLKQIDG